jgi:hypothetical protein
METNMIDYRKIMEQKLGRKLKSSEIVHHKDGNNENNSPSNLQLITSIKNHNKIPKKVKKISKEQVSKLICQTKQLELDSFYDSLKELFTPYQIELIIKKSEGRLLSKTDREVFSRIIKKKLLALANGQLFELAQKVIYEL